MNFFEKLCPCLKNENENPNRCRFDDYYYIPEHEEMKRLQTFNPGYLSTNFCKSINYKLCSICKTCGVKMCGFHMHIHSDVCCYEIKLY